VATSKSVADIGAGVSDKKLVSGISYRPAVVESSAEISNDELAEDDEPWCLAGESQEPD
jgi:hypothetical protein